MTSRLAAAATHRRGQAAALDRPCARRPMTDPSSEASAAKAARSLAARGPAEAGEAAAGSPHTTSQLYRTIMTTSLDSQAACPAAERATANLLARCVGRRGSSMRPTRRGRVTRRNLWVFLWAVMCGEPRWSLPTLEASRNRRPDRPGRLRARPPSHHALGLPAQRRVAAMLYPLAAHRQPTIKNRPPRTCRYATRAAIMTPSRSPACSAASTRRSPLPGTAPALQTPSLHRPRTHPAGGEPRCAMT